MIISSLVKLSSPRIAIIALCKKNYVHILDCSVWMVGKGYTKLELEHCYSYCLKGGGFPCASLLLNRPFLRIIGAVVIVRRYTCSV